MSVIVSQYLKDYSVEVSDDINKCAGVFYIAYWNVSKLEDLHNLGNQYFSTEQYMMSQNYKWIEDSLKKVRQTNGFQYSIVTKINFYIAIKLYETTIYWDLICYQRISGTLSLEFLSCDTSLPHVGHPPGPLCIPPPGNCGSKDIRSKQEARAAGYAVKTQECLVFCRHPWNWQAKVLGCK